MNKQCCLCSAKIEDGDRFPWCSECAQPICFPCTKANHRIEMSGTCMRVDCLYSKLMECARELEECRAEEFNRSIQNSLERARDLED